MEYQVEVTGYSSIRSRVRAINKEHRERIQNAAQLGANEAAQHMRNYVPKGRTYGLYRSIHTTDFRYAPGGAGGGGFYVATASTGYTPYAAFVLFGTGAGPDRRIYPQGKRAWQFAAPRDGSRYRAWTRGQKPNNYWVYGAAEAGQKAAREYLDRG